MRHIPDELADRIEGGAATLCHAWIVTRADAARFGFTDHDQDLTVDGVACRAASGWTGGAVESGLGWSAGTAAAVGALDDEAIEEADIVAGLWDGAQVEGLRVDWARPELFVRLWRGSISRLVREGVAFTAEVEGPLAALEKVAGRTLGRLCDARLGDGRCGVSPEHPAFATGCDKRFATCGSRFGNIANFQGFPTIPGEDFLTAYPASGERHDGGKR